MCLRDESAKQKMKGSSRVIVLCALHSGQPMGPTKGEFLGKKLI